jgi:hypothetical protein
MSAKTSATSGTSPSDCWWRQERGTDSRSTKYGQVIEPRFVTVNAAPPNKGMELTVKSVAPFARGRAKGAPLFSAARPGC